MIGIVCALKCEAECLIETLNLKPFSNSLLFPVYTQGSIFLILSGIGKSQAAAAVAYLYAISGERPFSAWLNIGIGGHPEREVGEGILAHQIIDQASRQTFYPTISWKTSVPTDSIYSVDRVEDVYANSGVYEMESAGFCSTAFKITTSEMIHCYKVISDNPELPPRKDPAFVHSLIASNQKPILDLIERVQLIQEELSTWSAHPQTVVSFIEKWHFTDTQLFQLRRLLKRWEVLFGDLPSLESSPRTFSKGKDVLSYLEQQLHVKLCSL